MFKHLKPMEYPRLLSLIKSFDLGFKGVAELQAKELKS